MAETPGPWEIQIQWSGTWVTVATGFASQGEAEWATGLWKQRHQCGGDPFRAIKVTKLEAAASALLAACEEFLDWDETNRSLDVPHSVADGIRAAVARVKGGG